MSVALAFLNGRGAVPIEDVAFWLGRSRRFVYSLIARGDLDKFTAGRVTADSVVRYYESFTKGVVLNRQTHATSAPVPAAGNKGNDSVARGRVAGAALISGGAR